MTKSSIFFDIGYKTFRTSAFCLKSDLSKAFDRMSWNFINKALCMYAFPPRFRGWIMQCIRSARFSILFQGSGDGFITPTRGIRQGCALSPYIFILCMHEHSNCHAVDRTIAG